MAGSKKGGLGKGMGALINNISSIETKSKENKKSKNILEKEVNGEIYVNIVLLEANKKQPRKLFKEEQMKELVDSIKEYGILQPLIVKKIDDKYEIVAGERRWRAAKKVGLKEVPVIIRDYDDRKAKEVAIIENIQRENLNPIEEALAYKQLIEDYDLSQEELAKRLSKNRSTLTNTLRLLKLSKIVQELIIDGQISQGHARVLIAIEDEDLQIKLAKEIIEKNLSVREVERLIKKYTKKDEKDRKKEKVDSSLDIFYKNCEEELRQIFSTQVHINRKDNSKGKIEIEYYSNSDFERVLDLLKEIG